MEDFVKPAGQTSAARNWVVRIFLTILCIYFYVLMEWLFFVTKPSFVSTLSTVDTVQVLLVTPLPLVLAGLAGLFLCWLPNR